MTEKKYLDGNDLVYPIKGANVITFNNLSRIIEIRRRQTLNGGFFKTEDDRNFIWAKLSQINRNARKRKWIGPKSLKEYFMPRVDKMHLFIHDYELPSSEKNKEWVETYDVAEETDIVHSLQHMLGVMILEDQGKSEEAMQNKEASMLRIPKTGPYCKIWPEFFNLFVAGEGDLTPTAGIINEIIKNTTKLDGSMIILLAVEHTSPHTPGFVEKAQYLSVDIDTGEIKPNSSCNLPERLDIAKIKENLDKGIRVFSHDFQNENGERLTAKIEIPEKLPTLSPPTKIIKDTELLPVPISKNESKITTVQKVSAAAKNKNKNKSTGTKQKSSCERTQRRCLVFVFDATNLKPDEEFLAFPSMKAFTNDCKERASKETGLVFKESYFNKNLVNVERYEETINDSVIGELFRKCYGTNISNLRIIPALADKDNFPAGLLLTKDYLRNTMGKSWKLVLQAVERLDKELNGTGPARMRTLKSIYEDSINLLAAD